MKQPYRLLALKTLHCIDWTNATAGSYESNFSEMQNDHSEQQMMVTVSENGCRPRFSCVKFTKMTNTLFMQLSQTRLWPLVENRDDPYNCSNFLYTSNKDIDRNQYRVRFPTLLLPDEQKKDVSFDLHEFTNFNVCFHGGVQCTVIFVRIL